MYVVMMASFVPGPAVGCQNTHSYDQLYNITVNIVLLGDKHGNYNGSWGARQYWMCYASCLSNVGW